MKSSLPMLLFVAAACGAEGVADTALDYPVPPTTSSDLAVRNLDYRVGELQRSHDRRPGDTALARELVELRLMRSTLLGQLEELDAVLALARSFGVDGPEARALLGRVASARHRFRDALVLTPAGDNLSRASLQIALGEPEAALQTLDGAPEGLGRELLQAAALADLGLFVEADRSFVAALRAYTDVSPFIVGDVYFRRGVMWAEKAGRPEVGRRMYEVGLSVLPEHATMNVHLAELEWAAGEIAPARARLEGLLAATSDPEVPGLLGEILADVGESAAASALVAQARDRYDELLAKHPEAFWDHGAEFFSGPGGDPERALAYALANLAQRPTERAYLVALLAAEAARDEPLRCDLAAQLLDPIHTAELRTLVAELRSLCAP